MKTKTIVVSHKIKRRDEKWFRKLAHAALKARGYRLYKTKKA